MMEIIDEDHEHDEERKNERENESENRVILCTIKRKQNERQNWVTKIKPEKLFSLLFQEKIIFFKWGKMIFL